MAFFGEAVFLEAAVGFFGDGAFDQTCGEGGVQVVGAEGGAVGKLEAGHAVERAEGLFPESAKESCDLVADLIAHLVGFGDFAECCEKGCEQEFDERGGVADLVTCAEDFVVSHLSLADHGFHRQEGEERVPVAEDEGLPEAADAAIAIGEGVDEFEFVVEDTAGDERVGVGAFQPGEKVFHEAVDTVCGRGEVNDLFALGDADRAEAEATCVIDE